MENQQYIGRVVTLDGRPAVVEDGIEGYAYIVPTDNQHQIVGFLWEYAISRINNYNGVFYDVGMKI